MQIIGISGKIGTGKSTVAKFLISEKLYNWNIVSFANLLKNEASRKYRFRIADAYSEEGKNLPVVLREGGSMTIRQLLQKHGSDMRSVDKDYWVNAMAVRLSMLSVYPGVVIDDVRFMNELEYVKSKNGKIIRLNPYPGYDKESDHESETALDGYKDFDMTFTPEYGRSHLREVAMSILSSIG
jgi:hypothetical protein